MIKLHNIRSYGVFSRFTSLVEEDLGCPFVMSGTQVEIQMFQKLIKSPWQDSDQQWSGASDLVNYPNHYGKQEMLVKHECPLMTLT